MMRVNMIVKFGCFFVVVDRNFAAIYAILAHLIGNKMSNIDALMSCMLPTKNLRQLVVEH